MFLDWKDLSANSKDNTNELPGGNNDKHPNGKIASFLIHFDCDHWKHPTINKTEQRLKQTPASCLQNASGLTLSCKRNMGASGVGGSQEKHKSKIQNTKQARL